MLGYNKYGSYGWVLFENLKGLIKAHQANDLEMRGYYRGVIAALAGEMVSSNMRKENIEFSTELYEKQVDRMRGLVENLLQRKQ